MINSYKKAGVDIKKAGEVKKHIKSLVKKTFSSAVLSEIGKFGGFFLLKNRKSNKAVLVSSVDGVGTKIKVALMTKKYSNLGVDIVNHCANDILVHGAKPLFFMDYMAFGKVNADVVNDVITGMAKACKKLGCSLIGGETAQMPDIYKNKDFDIAGFIVGLVDKNKVIDGSIIKRGDVIIGLSSSGLHTNGYTLARKVIFPGYKVNSYIKELRGTIGDVLLKPHIAYGPYMYNILNKYEIKGMAHITGGGFEENIGRILPDDMQAVIYKGSWKINNIFKFIQKLGNIKEREMFRTFNMGIGMVLIVKKEDVKGIFSKLKIKSYVIGSIRERAENKSVVFV